MAGRPHKRDTHAKSLMNEASEHAIRIWQLPREQWREEIKKLPERKALNNVVWPLRKAVIERLVLAEKAETSGCLPAGWPPRNG